MQDTPGQTQTGHDQCPDKDEQMIFDQESNVSKDEENSLPIEIAATKLFLLGFEMIVTHHRILTPDGLEELRNEQARRVFLKL